MCSVRIDLLVVANKSTETQVCSMDLSGYRVLAFATHGFVAGELKDVPDAIPRQR